MHGQAGLLEGLPQRVAVGAGRLQGDDEAASLADTLQPLGEPHQVGGIAAAPGTLEVRAGPAEDAQDVVLADVESGVDDGLLPLQQALEINLIDSHGAVCFAPHGDDLPHVDR